MYPYLDIVIRLSAYLQLFILTVICLPFLSVMNPDVRFQYDMRIIVLRELIRRGYPR